MTPNNNPTFSVEDFESAAEWLSSCPAGAGLSNDVKLEVSDRLCKALKSCSFRLKSFLFPLSALDIRNIQKLNGSS